MRLEQVFANIADERGQHLAVSVVGGTSLSYKQLHQRAIHYASFLQSQGVDKGDRVAIVSGHDVDSIALFWGVLFAGGIVVWMNHDAKPKDLTLVCQSALPKLVVAQNDKYQTLLEKVDTFGATVFLLRELEQSESLALKTADISEHDPAVIVFTSGSSGLPKGVCLSHKNLYTIDRAVIQHMPIHSTDIYLMVVPLHYVHGLMQLTVHLLAGASLHFHDNFVFPTQVVDTLVDQRCTGFSGVPFHFNALVTRGNLLNRKLPDLRWVTVTGGKLAADAILTILDHFPELEFHIAYGQTECAPRATALKPDRVREKPNSVGSPIPGVTVEILNDKNEKLADGEKGEVVISGDNIMLGYWNDPVATREVIDDQGKLHTGDIGYFDSDGDLFLIGRQSAMIKSAGERIIPEEIEQILETHAAVLESVVIGVEDSLLGQRVVACVRLTETPKDVKSISEEIRNLCLLSLPFARAPREIRVFDEFPRKANGKPDRVSLTNRYTS
ncbi:MAG: class I adenylate-forming enzyme family protein [Pseudomonadota bacterium]